jgi:hypothetical protein
VRPASYEAVAAGAVFCEDVSADNPILRMRRGHAAAAARQQELLRAEGPRPDQAVAEALSAATAFAAIGRWPAPRDPASEAAVLEVRRRWARIGKTSRRSAPR